MCHICGVTKQYESEVDTDMLLVSDFFTSKLMIMYYYIGHTSLLHAYNVQENEEIQMRWQDMRILIEENYTRHKKGREYDRKTTQYRYRKNETALVLDRNNNYAGQLWSKIQDAWVFCLRRNFYHEFSLQNLTQNVFVCRYFTDLDSEIIRQFGYNPC